jgi:putative SOS response-associated peptidase YedK
MCGRCCQSLEAKDIICACKYKKNEDSKEIEPVYRNEYNLGRTYTPKYNLAPQDLCLIMVSSKHFDENADSRERTILPALWSIIPRFHKGDYKKHGLTTNNARMESLEKSKLYKPLLTKGKRCVLIVEGLYHKIIQWFSSFINFFF